MRIALVVLILAYMLSQYSRAFLAVLTIELGQDIGASEADLSVASGVWFLVFALMQIPIGWALDTIGPRRVASVLLAVGCGGGGALFALAEAPIAVTIAMGLIGIGCSPILMASYYLLARQAPAAVFATLAGLILGIGSLGNIASATPTVWLVEAYGWRTLLWGFSGLAWGIAGLIFALVRDPPLAEASGKGNLLDLLRIPALWLIFPMMFVNYVPSAAIRGLWIGPYGESILGLDDTAIGHMTLVMALAMVLGSLIYGPMDRWFGTRKWVIVAGNVWAIFACGLMWGLEAPGALTVTVLFAAIGLFGASFPLLMAHGRAFFPPHLAGRGVTLMNLFGIGGVGVFQVLSGRLHTAAGGGAEAYDLLFGFFGLLLASGVALYLFSQDRTD